MIGSGTLTPRLDRLERGGLLARHPDPDGRRERILRLTNGGRQRVPDVVDELLAVENDLLAALPPHVRDRLCTDLEQLLAAVERPAG